MINKIKEWIFFKYGIRIVSKHILIIFILLASVLFLMGSIIFNSPKKSTLPTDLTGLEYGPNMAPRIKIK